MKWIIRAIGFIVFALTTQYLARISKIDILEDMTIFTIPSAQVVLPIAAFIWIMIDTIAGSTRSEKKRQIVFWSLCISIGVASFVVPPFMSKDGLGIGLLRFFFGMWVATIAIYGALAWGVEAIWMKKRKANQPPERTG